MTTPVKKYPRHRASRHNVPLIVAVALAAVLLGGSAIALVVSMKPSGNPVAITTTEPSPTVEETYDTPTPATTEPSTTPSSTPVATASTRVANPFPTGNGSGCDLNTKFHWALQGSSNVRVGDTVTIQGTVCLGKGQSIWAFNYQSNGLYVTAGNNAPILTRSGVWTWHDNSITGDTAAIVFVRADKADSDWIKGLGANPDYGDKIVINEVNITKAGALISRVNITVNQG